jgi:VWFA-related protein
MRTVLSCVFLLVCAGLVFAQVAGFSNETNAKVDRLPPLHVNSDLVQIPVTVLDRNNASVFGLEKEHFRLFDEKVEQTITHFAMEDAPISIGFVFDASSSMRDKMQKSEEAVTTLLRTANPGDEFFLVRFSDSVELFADLTRSTDEVQKQLSYLRPEGRTALLDAIKFSLRRMEKANNARRALIIISDGADNCSRYTLSELKNLVREMDIQIYALGIFNPFNTKFQSPEELAGPGLLREIAKQSGGRLFEIENVNQLPVVASKIGDALRAQYVLGYSPKAMSPNGKYHRVEVRLSPPRGSGKLQAYWRRGYYAPVE